MVILPQFPLTFDDADVTAELYAFENHFKIISEKDHLGYFYYEACLQRK